MTTRVLPYEEWDRLPEDMDPLTMERGPGELTMVVVEDDHGAIVGHVALYPMLHAECLWIAPPHRGKVAVARNLWTAIRQHAARDGWARVFTTSATSDMTRILAHLTGAWAIGALPFVVPIERIQ